MWHIYQRISLKAAEQIADRVCQLPLLLRITDKSACKPVACAVDNIVVRTAYFQGDTGLTILWLSKPPGRAFFVGFAYCGLIYGQGYGTMAYSFFKANSIARFIWRPLQPFCVVKSGALQPLAAIQAGKQGQQQYVGDFHMR
jgi:hypothetical protein